ncbi:hypothetical protein CLV51_109137 [Chitinophaga niastensis]|uniref:Uncharacterized protein n=1 Tax=Chitinophaga niastensis TaxID=536980 RepID=A0A2P8HA88_CHINA|nr:hypothetical protein [Chitinophaga niastensis]PSL43143.1 hypothetical protein CLV51_109137 [Chitinophaga niastensis]
MFNITLILTALHLIYYQATNRADLFPFNNIRHHDIRERLADTMISFITLLIPLPAFILHSKIWISLITILSGLSIAEEWNTWWHIYFWNPEKAWVKTAQHNMITYARAA